MLMSRLITIRQETKKPFLRIITSIHTKKGLKSLTTEVPRTVQPDHSSVKPVCNRLHSCGNESIHQTCKESLNMKGRGQTKRKNNKEEAEPG